MIEKTNGKCSKCGWGEVNPYTKRTPLEINHIDGNSKNNIEINLEILCPNCHSLTDSYKGANKGNGRENRKWIGGKYASVAQSEEQRTCNA